MYPPTKGITKYDDETANMYQKVCSVGLKTHCQNEFHMSDIRLPFTSFNSLFSLYFNGPISCLLIILLNLLFLYFSAIYKYVFMKSRIPFNDIYGNWESFPSLKFAFTVLKFKLIAMIDNKSKI